MNSTLDPTGWEKAPYLRGGWYIDMWNAGPEIIINSYIKALNCDDQLVYRKARENIYLNIFIKVPLN